MTKHLWELYYMINPVTYESKSSMGIRHCRCNGIVYRDIRLSNVDSRELIGLVEGQDNE